MGAGVEAGATIGGGLSAGCGFRIGVSGAGPPGHPSWSESVGPAGTAGHASTLSGMPSPSVSTTFGRTTGHPPLEAVPATDGQRSSGALTASPSQWPGGEPTAGAVRFVNAAPGFDAAPVPPIVPPDPPAAMVSVVL